MVYLLRILDAMPLTRRQFQLVGWLSLSQLVGWGTFYYAFTLFNEPLGQAFGWSSSEINLALTLGFISWAASAPMVGNALDRFGGRSVMSAGTVAGVIAFLGWALSSSLFLFYASWVLMGVAMACSLYEPAFYVLTRSFPDSYKKVITWLTLAGGFASTLFIPLTDWFIRSLGWQHALFTLALVNLCIALPIHWWKLPGRSPAGMPGQAGGKLLDFSLFSEDAFKVQTFWGLNLWFVVFNSVATGVTFLFIPLLTELGADRSTVILSYSMIGPMQVLGRLALVWLDGKQKTLILGTMTVCMASVGIASASLFPNRLPGLIVFALFFGTSKGIMTIIKGTAVADKMDISVYGRTNGWLSLCSMVAKALTPALVAAWWTRSGDPARVLLGLAGLCFVALAGIVMVKRETG